MRNSNTDLRVIRTKESIRHALVELINEKGFEAITVKDITIRAKINRGTFYAHYQDKFDLMTKCEEEIMLDMSRITKQNFPSVIAALETDSQTLTPFSLTVSLFEYLNINSGFMKAVLGPKGDLSFQTRLKEFMWETLYGNNPNAFIKEENFLVPGQYLASYMGTAIIGVIQQWLESGRKESPQEMARILTTITANGPYFAAGLKK
ncbi:TetR/AcrR family transcriptional regulator [Peribacillus simplex]|uniref:TetR family transcriptional regulator n=2 Tax=Peribacillus simplex TaxID=1478 RepID=A0A223EN22_9BACI|nr:TetR/AcrR family transcriptional regulator [Peribacillus simplex]KQU17376.1 TetR family transcriptional regulator [Bacillus sp. Leaf13]KRF68276.1 TetR family transcriptional regulator [Bacillus sp. Soil768D1]ASS96581.1 TetR family transcriptional regulator [Peribacillus simplex NBRC 15720 = DSM 1321]MEC1400825.1 TetR/AcrR family transcriptional regulator [Peribacillus simplex]MED3912728.1 TetR/AcrR family transcriptional regulator [Peribacillus simplex]